MLPCHPVVASPKGSLRGSLNTLCHEPRPNDQSVDDGDGPGTLSRLGPRHDNDHVYIHEISILPTADECLSIDRSPWLSARNVSSPHHMHHSNTRHLDTHFRLLRYESTEKIRDVNYTAAQKAFMNGGAQAPSLRDRPWLESPAGHRFFLYQNARFEGAIANDLDGFRLRFSFDCPPSLRGRTMSESGRLEIGMLCAILCLDHNTNELSIHYFNIEWRQGSLGPTSGNVKRAAVEVSIPPYISDEDLRDDMSVVAGVRPNVTMALVEYPKLLYVGFANALHCLQTMSDAGYAFSQYISPLQEVYDSRSEQQLNVETPSYARRPDFAFDLSPLTGRPDLASRNDLQGPASAVKLQELRQNTSLDDGQAAALLWSLNREFSFIQGPPGCGKTFLGIALARILLASRSAERKVPLLLVCRTNHALDNIMAGLRDAGVEKLLRIGGSSKEEWTNAIKLRSVSQGFRYSQNENVVRHGLLKENKISFGQLDAWSQGISKEVVTGFRCWQHIAPIVKRVYPRVYAQLLTANVQEPLAQAFTYDYWAKGGDLATIEHLHQELLKRLEVQDRASVGDLRDAEARARLLLADIAGFTKAHASDAGSDDVWQLSLEGRQALIEEWQRQIDKGAITQQLCHIHNGHKRILKSARLIREKKDVRTIQQQNVVGITSTACAGKREMLIKAGFEILICEEAGELLEAHALCALLPTLKHAISIGDPLQLRPEIEEYRLALENRDGLKFRLNESLFERIMKPVDPQAKTIPTTQLNVQRRMHPDIARITEITYPNLLSHPSTWAHPEPKGLRHRMWWLDHSVPEDSSSDVSKSITNMHEVQVVNELVTYLLRGSDYISPGDIAVLTPYSRQLHELRKALSGHCAVWMSNEDKEKLVDMDVVDADNNDLDERKQLNLPMSSLLRLATIDNFQGEEAKVIILSTVRSGDKLGFLKIRNRINVMCSRAKHGFYVVGNSKALNADPVWKTIHNVFASKGAIGQHITLQCDRHPVYSRAAQTARDFQDFQCMIPCHQELECGHVCTKMCHDPALHTMMECPRECKRSLECGHPCENRCDKPCGPCQHLERRYRPSCSHYASVSCASGEIPCDHFEGYIDFTCGRHAVGYTCGERDSMETYDCDATCGEELPCGHQCFGLCAFCSIAGEHAFCRQRCGKRLKCGHKCLAECHGGSECPRCEEICPPACAHTESSRKCGATTVPCMHPVSASSAKELTCETTCCLTTMEVDAKNLVTADEADGIFHAGLRTISGDITKLKELVDAKSQALVHSTQLFLMHGIVSNKAIAAAKNIEGILRRGDEVRAVEAQVTELGKAILRFEHGLSAIHATAGTSGSPFVVDDQIKSRLAEVKIRAVFARIKDIKTTATFLRNSEDQSQQMERTARELLVFARTELVGLLEKYADSPFWMLDEVLGQCQKLRKELDGLLR